MNLEISEQELKDLKLIRNYFGEHDTTPLEHMAYDVLNRLINNASPPPVEADTGEGEEDLVKHWQQKHAEAMRLNDELRRGMEVSFDDLHKPYTASYTPVNADEGEQAGRGEDVPMKFVIWYSGMNEDSCSRAYKRWRDEQM